MEYSQRHIPIESYLMRNIKTVLSYTMGISAPREIETRSILNILKEVTGKARFHISLVSLEVTDHKIPQYVLTGPLGYITFTLQD
jgi:hypothetical protein